jgi:ATP-dependent helicase/DNAse subunit B
VEKQFPRFHAQDPFFPDAARCRLNASGIRVRTAADFEREERALFDSAITRATMLVTLSYPEFDARGERNLQSLYLEDLILAPVEAQAVRPEPRFAPLPRGPVEILAPGLRDFLLQKTGRLSPTALETFLQCPFQYFSRSLLRLKPAPGRPEERLDFLTQGNIVHAVLAEWWKQPQEMAPLFERIFERFLEEKLIPSGYHTERLRNAILEDLCKFASEDKWPRGAFRSDTEVSFVFPLGDALEISGKIDRLDVAPDGQAYVIDYKYSNAQRIKDRVKNPSLLQAPLYLMAAERVLGMKPAGMFYVGLKSGIEYAGWSEAALLDSPPMPEDWLKITEQRTLQVVDQIRAGRVEVAPANPDNCRFCDFSDVCRIEVRAAESREAGGA